MTIRGQVKWCGIVLMGATLSIPSVAGATLVHTSRGPVDSSCSRTVPKGADVYGDTGEVSVNGTTIVSASEASAGSAACQQAGGMRQGGDDGWAMTTTAWAEDYQGVYAYDEIEAGMWVPEAPDVPANGGNQLLWCGFENFPLAGGQWTSVIQPEIWWMEGTGWYITAEALDNSYYGYNVNFFSPNESVSTGDYITCNVTQVGTNNFRLEITDQMSGAWSGFNWHPGSGANWGPYQWAQLAVYEVQNVSNCNGLSKSNYAFIEPLVLEQAGTSWNAFYDVLPTASVQPGYATGGCSYDSTWSPWSSGDPYTYFSWSY